MRPSTRWLPALLLAASCATTPPTPGSPQPTATTTALHGVATINDSHCGGARMTDEMMQRLTHPAANLAFLVIAGDRNSAAEPAARFTTAADGSFDVPQLAPGRYCLVRADRAISREQEDALLALPPPAPQPPHDPNETYVDQDCLARLPLGCDATWDTAHPSFVPDLWLPGRQCSWNQPCVTYRGPRPP